MLLRLCITKNEGDYLLIDLLNSIRALDIPEHHLVWTPQELSVVLKPKKVFLDLGISLCPSLTHAHTHTCEHVIL